jgi:hypothetical protein
MDAKYFVFNYSRQAQIIKNFRAISPYVDGAIFSKTFVIEAIYLGNLTALVVPANQSNTIGVSNLAYRIRQCMSYHSREDRHYDCRALTFKANRSRNVSTL